MRQHKPKKAPPGALPGKPKKPTKSQTMTRARQAQKARRGTTR